MKFGKICYVGQNKILKSKLIETFLISVFSLHIKILFFCLYPLFTFYNVSESRPNIHDILGNSLLFFKTHRKIPRKKSITAFFSLFSSNNNGCAETLFKQNFFWFSVRFSCNFVLSIKIVFNSRKFVCLIVFQNNIYFGVNN